MRVRDELGELFSDAEFAQAFGVRGRRGWSPGQLALVTVLQFAANLTDRAAAHRVRSGMDVKYTLGMELDDPGFDASVLSEFRARLVEHGLEERALDLLLTALKDKGMVKAGGRQRTDSTRVLAAVRDLNRLELAGKTLRAALESLACAVPDWLAEAVPIRQWTERYRPRINSWQLPSSQAQRTELALAYGRDGFALLEAAHAADAPVWLRELPTVQVLGAVWLQNYMRTVTETGREVKRRESEDLPPSRLRLTSPYDLDARYGLKQGSWWTAGPGSGSASEAFGDLRQQGGRTLDENRLRSPADSSTRRSFTLTTVTSTGPAAMATVCGRWWSLRTTRPGMPARRSRPPTRLHTG
ncbi:transposase [Streptomyces sp. NPDC058335]|uniref:transposase n=1 Tax=Streptomyces sp. NPDC058335 TaxID=3346451 RepID=UPI00364DCBEB